MIIGNPITLGGGGGAKGQPLSSLTEGSLVSVLEGGKLTPFYVAKHNYESDLNGTGRTLLVRQYLLPKMNMNSSAANAYASSTMDGWLNGDYRGMLSPVVSASLGVTEFKYTPGSGNNTVTTLQRAVFLPSMTEVGQGYSQANVEGTALPIASLLKVAYLNGVAEEWWTRTPVKNSTTAYMSIYTNGEINLREAYAATLYSSPRPCFTLPATMTLTTEPYADGSWGLADEDILFDTETASTTAKAGVTYTNGIADLTPAQLHEIAAAISANPNIDKYMGTIYYDKGDVHRKISTGDQNTVTFNGGNYAIDLIGFNHDDLSNGAAYGVPTATGKAGMTFQMHDCYASTNAMNSSATNSGGWTSSVMRKTYMPFFLTNISPNEFKNVIKSVNKLTSAGNKSSTINATEDKMFLLSEIEVFGATTYSFAGEGSQYAYYKAGNSKVKKLSGTNTAWWTRSPYATYAGTYCLVNTAGNSSSDGANSANGTAVAYCI